MVAIFRQTWKISAMMLWLLFMGIYSFPCKFGGWKSIKKAAKKAHLWGSGIARIMNLRIKVHGDISQFDGGLIVSNHSGYLDIITHAAIFPLRFTPKLDIKHWPVLGYYLGISRAIWIDRRSKQKSKELLQEFIDTMRHGIPLIVYPEGTSTDNRSGILPFKSTPFEAAARGNCPIQPIVTILKPPKGKNVAWYGKEESLFPHFMRTLGIKRVNIDIYILPVVHPEGRDRKQLAECVHAMMAEKFNEVVTAL